MSIVKKIAYLFACSFSLIVLVNALYAETSISTPSLVVASSSEVVVSTLSVVVELNAEALLGTYINEKIYEHDGIKYIKGESMGNFGLSGYCACKKCGTGTGITASGKKVRENHTIAADWKLLPKGTMIILENAIGKDGTDYSGVYAVEDRGGGIKNKRLDIYRPTHELAALVTHYGRCYGDVYIAIPIGG